MTPADRNVVEDAKKETLAGKENEILISTKENKTICFSLLSQISKVVQENMTFGKDKHKHPLKTWHLVRNSSKNYF